MEYEVLSTNEDGTVRVKMTIEDHVLEQNFDALDLDKNVKHGMAIFKSELNRNATSEPPKLDKGPVKVDALPEIPAEDFEQIPDADITDE